MLGYWKLLASLFGEQHFWDELLLILGRKLMEAVMWNKWWEKLKFQIMSFAADNIRRLNQVKLIEKTACE